MVEVARLSAPRFVIAVVLSLLAVPAPAQTTEQCNTSKEGYTYFVYVPKTYSDDNPAGIHVFFSGQGGCANNGSFGQWAKTLERHNLIGINLQYADGKNDVDTGGKTQAAVEALQGVIGKYKILPGRGMVGSFSGGGLPHAGLLAAAAKGGGPLPFCHSSLYGSNYWQRIRSNAGMSWTVAIGSEEWGMGKPTLGDTQNDRAAELYALAARGGCPDVYLRIQKGKGHSISGADVQAASDAFERSDLAFIGFFYAPDFPERELKPIITAANRLDLALASKQVEKLVADAKAPEEVLAKARKVKERLDARIDHVIRVGKDLAEKDPGLCEFYGKIYLKQLRTHPREDELKTALDDARKTDAYRKSAKAFQSFISTFARGHNTIFPSTANAAVHPDAAKFLQDLHDDAVPASLIGLMTGEILKLVEP